MVDDVDDDTVIRPRAPLSPVPSGPSGDADDTVIRPRSSPPIGSPVGDPEDTIVRPGRTRVPLVPSSAMPDVSVSAPTPAAVAERVASIRVVAPGSADQVVRLDRPVLIGRRPALPRVLVGAEPVLLAVGRSHGQVSGSHVSIRSEGQTVVVEDLRSTNGTVVRPPGSSPYRLPSGAARVVLTGTLVEIGDGISIEILSPHLRAASGSVPAPPPTRERSTP